MTMKYFRVPMIVVALFVLTGCGHASKLDPEFERNIGDFRKWMGMPYGMQERFLDSSSTLVRWLEGMGCSWWLGNAWLHSGESPARSTIASTV